MAVGAHWLDLITFQKILHWSLVRNLGRLNWVRLQQSQQQSYLFLLVCSVKMFYCCCPNSGIAVSVFVCLCLLSMSTDVNTFECTQGLHEHRTRICAESWPRERKPCRTGNWTRVSITSGFSVTRRCTKRAMPYPALCSALCALRGWLVPLEIEAATNN